MARICTICSHPECPAINKEIAARKPYRGIAGQFGLTDSSVTRHVKECIPGQLQVLLETRQNQLKAGLSVDDELAKTFQRINKLLDACDNWLIDPTGQGEYTLEPRGREVQVVYDDFADLTDQGKPRRKKDNLQSLLAKVETGKIQIDYAETKTADPRDLILKTAAEIRAHLDFYAKLRGLFQAERKNETDVDREERIRKENRAWAEEQLAKVMADHKLDRPGGLAWLQSEAPTVCQYLH